MGLELTIFGKKKFSDLLKEIYDNSKKKDQQINALIGELRPLVLSLGDATLVVPLIKEYMEIGIKNDDHLIKMAAIVQRMDSGQKGYSDIFDPEELAKILEQSEELGKGKLGNKEE